MHFIYKWRKKCRFLTRLQQVPDAIDVFDDVRGGVDEKTGQHGSPVITHDDRKKIQKRSLPDVRPERVLVK